MILETVFVRILEDAQKAQETKTNKGNDIELKSFCTTMETINKMKKQSTEQEKTFANHITDKRLTSKIYKEFIKLNCKIKTAHRKKQISI